MRKYFQLLRFPLTLWYCFSQWFSMFLGNHLKFFDLYFIFDLLETKRKVERLLFMLIPYVKLLEFPIQDFLAWYWYTISAFSLFTSSFSSGLSQCSLSFFWFSFRWLLLTLPRIYFYLLRDEINGWALLAIFWSLPLCRKWLYRRHSMGLSTITLFFNGLVGFSFSFAKSWSEAQRNNSQTIKIFIHLVGRVFRKVNHLFAYY